MQLGKKKTKDYKLKNRCPQEGLVFLDRSWTPGQPLDSSWISGQQLISDFLMSFEALGQYPSILQTDDRILHHLIWL